MTTADEMYAVVHAQLGVKESPSGSNCQKYSHELGRPCQSWCADGLVWCSKECGLALPSTSSYTPTLADGFKRSGQWVTGAPRFGDFGFIDFPGDNKHRIQHVVFVVSANSTSVATIEFNTSSGTKGSQDNGGVVAARKRARSLFVGFGRPNYTPAGTTSSTPTTAPATTRKHSEDDMFYVINFGGNAGRWVYFPQNHHKVLIQSGAALAEIEKSAGYGGRIEMAEDDLRAIPYPDPAKSPAK